jgi:hypothetical protein
VRTVDAVMLPTVAVTAVCPPWRPEAEKSPVLSMEPRVGTLRDHWAVSGVVLPAAWTVNASVVPGLVTERVGLAGSTTSCWPDVSPKRLASLPPLLLVLWLPPSPPLDVSTAELFGLPHPAADEDAESATTSNVTGNHPSRRAMGACSSPPTPKSTPRRVTFEDCLWKNRSALTSRARRDGDSHRRSALDRP